MKPWTGPFKMRQLQVIAWAIEPAGHTARRLRPLARRLEITARPDLVDMRTRKP